MLRECDFQLLKSALEFGFFFFVFSAPLSAISLKAVYARGLHVYHTCTELYVHLRAAIDGLGHWLITKIKGNNSISRDMSPVEDHSFLRKSDRMELGPGVTPLWR